MKNFQAIYLNRNRAGDKCLRNSTMRTASALEIELVPLPAYSPDFMPVEHLWHWLREDITYHTCYETKAELIEQVTDFARRLNAEPIAVAERLWVTTHLEPTVEKLRVST